VLSHFGCIHLYGYYQKKKGKKKKDTELSEQKDRDEIESDQFIQELCPTAPVARPGICRFLLNKIKIKSNQASPNDSGWAIGWFPRAHYASSLAVSQSIGSLPKKLNTASALVAASSTSRAFGNTTDVHLTFQRKERIYYSACGPLLVSTWGRLIWRLMAYPDPILKIYNIWLGSGVFFKFFCGWISFFGLPIKSYSGPRTQVWGRWYIKNTHSKNLTRGLRPIELLGCGKHQE
jgi:hypothetical protein